jgi:hypothetical protein
MLQPSSRAEQFKAEMAEMKLNTGGASRERPLLAVGILLMIGGIVLALIAYSAASNVKVTPGSNVDLLNSGEYVPLAIAGLAISIAGGFMFLRYSLARFLRFWLLRQSYEQQVALDARTTDAVE